MSVKQERDNESKAMGVGLTADNKRAVVVGASMIYRKTPSALAKYNVRCIDGCAWFRKVVPPTLGPDVSPWNAVRSIFWPSILRDSMSKVTYLAFDDGRKIPEMRHRFYATRRYKKSDQRDAVRWDETLCEEDGTVYKTVDLPASKDMVSALAPHNMPTRWINMWNSKSGKAKLWSIIVECIEVILRTETLPPGMSFVIDTSMSERIYYPALRDPEMDALPEFHYGEGDLKCVVAALHYATARNLGPVLLMTIDWDVPLITMMNRANVDVLIGNVFMEDAMPDAFPYDPTTTGQIQLTKRGSKNLDKPVPAYEIIHVPDIVRLYPDLVARQHLLMLVLCAGSVDYSLGLKRFGFTESSMMDIFHKNSRCGFMKVRWIENYYPLDKRDNPMRRMLRVDLTTFVCEVLRKAKRRPASIKTDCIVEFTEEMHCILFGLRYFGGYDMDRVGRGGPPLPDFTEELFPGVGSVTELVDGDGVEFGDYMIEETHPPTIDTLPYHPSVAFDGYQLEAITRLLDQPDDDDDNVPMDEGID